MESKKVTYLRRLLTNGARNHDGRGGAGRSIAQAVQGAQESALCGPLLRPPSGRGPHFRAGDGPGTFSGYYKKGRTTATSSRATGPPSQQARDARGSSTCLWHACEGCHVSACLYMVCVARLRSDVHISHRCMVLWHSTCQDYMLYACMSLKTGQYRSLSHT